MRLAAARPARRPSRPLAVLAVAAAVLVAGLCVAVVSPPRRGPAPARTAATRFLRIMPLGDSITAGETVPGGYRIRLAQLLGASGQSFDFVGTQSNGPPSLEHPQHEGHPGWCLATCKLNLDDHLAEWLALGRPDVVLLDAGTNDLLKNAGPAVALARLHTVLDHLYAAAPQAHVYVAQIYSGGAFTGGAAFDAGVPAVVAQERAAGHVAVVVDMAGSAGFTDADFVDRIHPTAAGAAKMADAWFAALQANGF